ncbi:MAG: hypothetical protein Q8P51_07870 [Ignavibacteria bacterium]|nr:hypothetical protein [Ignavibacteria bacterium]
MNRRSFITSLALAPLAAVVTRPLGFFDPFERSIGSSADYSGSMWIYLWDLVDEGYEKVLRNLSENGLTSISLATAYHAGKFLAPHNPKRKVVFLEDGTVYFKPDPKMYGRIHPRINSLVKAGHGLEKAKKAADKFGFKTRAWVVCCHNTPLGMTYPDIASESAFGDKLYHNLCPSNDDVRRYIRSLVSDIASHGVDAIELEALQFQGYAHGYHHEREGIELNSAARFLLGLCFCPSCIKRAQSTRLDLAPIRRFTKQTLEAWFADPAATAEKYPALDKLPSDLFDPMLEWRKSVISSFVEEVAVGGRGSKLRQMVSVDPLARKLVSVDPAASAKVTGGILALGYVKDGVALLEPLKSLQASIGRAKITLGLQVGLPESGGKKEFLSKISTAKELGVNSFNFYNYGFIPSQNLTWIKEAFGN